MVSLPIPLLSIVGAALVLAAYGASQYAGMRSDGVRYGLLNPIGSALLALSAFAPMNAGVLAVEPSWAVLSLGITLRALQRGRSPADTPAPVDRIPSRQPGRWREAGRVRTPPDAFSRSRKG